MTKRHRRGRDRGRHIETVWYHPATGKMWTQKDRPPSYERRGIKDEEIEHVEIRFHHDSAFFFVDMEDGSSIQDESLKVVRTKLQTFVQNEGRTNDSDWTPMILVSDDWDHDNMLGISFTHVGVKDDHYRSFDEQGKKLHRNMESTRGCVFMEYSPKRWKEIVALTKSVERFREVMPRLICAFKSKRFETRLTRLVADMEVEFKKLSKKQRELSFD